MKSFFRVDKDFDVLVLQNAIKLNPEDANAPYYLGNLWYDKRQYKEAIACWEISVCINDKFPTVHRNLSVAYYNKLEDSSKALTFMEKAFALDTTIVMVKKLNKSVTFYFELDLFEKLRKPI